MQPRVKIENLAARLFGLAVRGRETLYRHGVVRPQIVKGIRVISIGNLAVGGTGKTPLVLYLAEKLREKGERVAVVSRGYGGGLENSGGIVSNGEGPLVSAEAAGDEAYLHASRLTGVSVWVGANRVEQVRAAREKGATVALLDDGFQHRKLHRNMDILLASPSHLAEGASLLPQGVLREPPGSAARADLIGGFADDWREETGELPDFSFEQEPSHLLNADGDEHPPSVIHGARVYLLSGIANPERFAQTVRDMGATVVGHTAYRDHHCFCESDLSAAVRDALNRQADRIIVTEKDWVRMGVEQRRTKLPLSAVVVSLRFNEGEGLLMDAVETVLGRST